jgi:hypothetical protein
MGLQVTHKRYIYFTRTTEFALRPYRTVSGVSTSSGAQKGTWRPTPFLGPLRRECVPQATMCMVMVGIDPELSDELEDQIELSRALAYFNGRFLDKSNHQLYTN